MACVRREVGEDEIDDEKIYWVFTVPQSWTGRSKQFMREAAYEVMHIIARQDSYANISICRLATLCVGTQFCSSMLFIFLLGSFFAILC